MPIVLFCISCAALILLGRASRKIHALRLLSSAKVQANTPVHVNDLVYPSRVFAALLLAFNPLAAFQPSFPGASLAVKKAGSAPARGCALLTSVLKRPQAGAPAAGFHHIAFVTEDPCSTRNFFEDLLGLTMTHCEGGPGLMHAFFDAGAGASMAFFLFDTVKPSVGTDLSVSLGVPKWLNRAAYRVTKEQAIAIRNRFQANGFAEVIEMSHGWCDSLYIMDPNGVMVELCVDTPGFIPDSETARQRWLEQKPKASFECWGLGKMMASWAAMPPVLAEVPALGCSPHVNKSRSPAGFHHLSFTTKDEAATCHFYEDLFGFPLVHCDLDRFGDSWIKTAFFDIGKGSFIAFQAFENIGEKSDWHSDLNRPLNFPPWANHAAFRATFEEVQSVRSRMELEGINPIMEMSHGWCYSLYYKDPNGVTVELCVDTPGFEPDRAGAVQMWEASARKAEV